MSILSKAIAGALIIMAVISTGYTGYFAMEYSNSLSALAEFSASTSFDPTDIRESGNYSYLTVNVTLENPSDIEINIYELNLALFVMNATSGGFTRIGKPVMFFSQYQPITVNANSERVLTLYMFIEDVEDYIWNMEHSEENKLQFRVDPYMEIRYTISGYDFTNTYAYGVWHWTCEPCGRGPFD